MTAPTQRDLRGYLKVYQFGRFADAGADTFVDFYVAVPDSGCVVDIS
jgi:hypothetical protein